MADLKYTVEVGVQQALRSLDDFSKKIERVGRDFDAVNSHVSRLTTVLAATLTAAGFAAGRFADQVNDIAAAFDTTVGRVMGLGQAMELAGGRFDNVSKVYENFAKRQQEVAEGNEKTIQLFRDLGISLKDIGTLSQEELMKKAVGALAALPTAAERSARSFQVFGKALQGVDLKTLNDQIDTQTQKYSANEAQLKLMGEAFGKIPDLIADIHTAFAIAFEPIFKMLKDVNISVEDLVKGFRIMAGVLVALGGAAIIGGIGKLVAVFRELNTVVGKNKLLTIIALLATAGVSVYEWLKQTEKLNDATQEQIPTLDTVVVTATRIKDTAAEIESIYQKQLQAMRDIVSQYLINMGQGQDALDLQRKMLGLREKDRQILQETTRIDEQTRRALFDLSKKYSAFELATQADLRAEYEAQQKAIMAAGEAYKKKAAETIAAIYEEQRTFEYGWRGAMDRFVEDATNAARQAEQLFNRLTSGLEDAFVEFAKTGRFSFRNLLAGMAEDLLRSNIRQLLSQVFGGRGGGSNIFGSIGKIFGFAGGGVVPGNRPIMVGERGPEIFMPPGQGTIIPNNQLGGSTSVVYNISAVDARSFQELVARDPQFIYAVTEQGRRSLPVGV